ncbi:adenosylcobinamide-phosphate synthase CbiB [Aureimonas sp. N4]|uniref:adenosylcobinamide-phosphate synthase CbiB n=1 Tax=Aureimonas sp. N4 TaxID=1638165 RepID=UPI000783E689|nr:adenosylcobinamide-phosphate synthase CbiB [Aureimonas sp. N4]
MVLLLATLIDRLVGDPDWLWRRWPHPVVWFGALIGAADRGLNRAAFSFAGRRALGLMSILALAGLALGAGLLIQRALVPLGWAGLLIEALIASVFLAQKSLSDHVEAVRAALERGGLDAGRRAVSMIVGRDPNELDEAGVCRAAIESLAENASDGVVAPWLALALFGLPGLLVYKMVNTADSMIGHRSERHLAFGWGAARLDDVLNLVPARLTALLFSGMAGMGGNRAVGRRAWKTAWRDAATHRSPNAGWPEAAMAGALALSLGGPRRYGALVVDAPCLGAEGRREANPQDIAAALRLFGWSMNALLAVAALGSLVSLV